MWRWLIWITVVVLACAGLPRYRIDNDIRRWMPRLAGQDAAAEAVIVGFEREYVDGGELAGRIRGDAAVGAIVPFAGDGGMDGLLVFAADAVNGRTLLAAIRRATNGHAHVALAGQPVFSEALDDWSQRGLIAASGVIVLIGTVALYLTTRRLWPTVEGLVAVFSSQLVLTGWIAWHGRAMDMMLSMTPPLMMALGFSFAAHRAMRRGVNQALLLSMATTYVGIASSAFTDFAPIRSFALWGSTGVVVTWAAVMLLVRPPRPGVEEHADTPARPVSRMGRVRTRGFRFKLTCLGVAATVCGLSLAGAMRIEHDVLSYFPPSSRIVRDYRLLNRELTGMLPFEVTVVGEADPAAMLAATPGVRRVLPVSSLNGERHYMGFADNDAMPKLAEAQRGWEAWALERGVRLEWAGVAAQLDHIGRSVQRTVWWAVPGMAVIAGLAAWLIDRRWSSALLSIYVNIFPVAVLTAVILVTGHTVGLTTLVIASLTIGVAIDDTLHLLLARRELGSMSEAMHVCLRPCLCSSLTVAVCMATFALCPFRPTAEFGLLVAFVVLVAAVGDLVLLPAAESLLSPTSAPIAGVTAVN